MLDILLLTGLLMLAPQPAPAGVALGNLAAAPNPWAWRERSNDYYRPASGVLVGNAYYYRPGLMERVARNRGIRLRPLCYDTGFAPGCVNGYTSVTDGGLIDTLAWISIKGGVPEKFQVIDCSNPVHLPAQIGLPGQPGGKRIVAELDYASAARWNYVADGKAPAVLWAVTEIDTGELLH